MAGYAPSHSDFTTAKLQTAQQGNETPGSKKNGEFTDVKKDGKPFKGANEPDNRRNSNS
ncbi:MAG: hypothetical protein H0X40_16505 [Chthoniobacterales bacterium]|nr:hypothetical protein [Chthoniobacterales bacterium]